MDDPVLVTGDDISLSATLRVDNATFAIDTGATVEASIVDPTHKTVLAGPVAQNSATPGADWANSLVIVTFSSTDTASITHQGKAILEIQVNDNGKRTWFKTIVLVLGTIA